MQLDRNWIKSGVNALKAANDDDAAVQKVLSDASVSKNALHGIVEMPKLYVNMAVRPEKYRLPQRGRQMNSQPGRSLSPNFARPGVLRWVTDDLRRIASGEASEGMGDVQW